MIKKAFKLILVLILLIIMSICIYCLYKENKENIKQENIYEDIIEIVEEKNNTKEDKENDIDIKKLYDINNDIVGWLKIENSNMNYPIMQNKTIKNYYLRRNFYKEYSYYGTPYLKEECNLNSSDNLIIYGHHIKGQKIFGELENYRNIEYYKEHQTIKLYTLDDLKEYKIIYIFKTIANTGFEYYSYMNFNDKSEFDTFNRNCKELAFFDTKVETTYGDKYITLSTCDYTSKNARLIVVAKQI